MLITILLLLFVILKVVCPCVNTTSLMQRGSSQSMSILCTGATESTMVIFRKV